MECVGAFQLASARPRKCLCVELGYLLVFTRALLDNDKRTAKITPLHIYVARHRVALKYALFSCLLDLFYVCDLVIELVIAVRENNKLVPPFECRNYA